MKSKSSNLLRKSLFALATALLALSATTRADVFMYVANSGNNSFGCSSVGLR